MLLNNISNSSLFNCSEKKSSVTLCRINKLSCKLAKHLPAQVFGRSSKCKTPLATASKTVETCPSLAVQFWAEPSGQPSSQFFESPQAGKPYPMGPSIEPETGHTNLALFSSTASAVTLVLFTEQDLAAGRSTAEIQLDPFLNRTGDVWHVMLPGLDPNLLYGYRVQGQHQDRDAGAAGLRHDKTKVVIDPYAPAVLSRRQFGQLAAPLPYGKAPAAGQPPPLGLSATWPQAAGCLPHPVEDHFDWAGDRPPRLPIERLVIYEMHVRGFTQHPSSGVKSPGTYAGMIEKLDYLKSLGVTAVELLPVFEFNELEYFAPIPGGGGRHRLNFWGYSTVAFFSPMTRYSAEVAAGAHVRAARREFKQLVKECHRRGIEVILDVVFNHTAEGNERGPTLSFRGVDNRAYYMLAAGGEYYNYSGCGNTLNSNHPATRRMVLDCLRHWVQEFHVDGFRFDLASILTRAHSAWHPAEVAPEVPEFAKERRKKEAAAAAAAVGSRLPRSAPSSGGDPASSGSASASTSSYSSSSSSSSSGESVDGNLARSARAEFEGSPIGTRGSSSSSGGREGKADEAREEAGPVPPPPGSPCAVQSGGAVLSADGAMTNGSGAPTGHPLSDPPLVELLSEHPDLRGVKFIAEAWDCDGLNQVGAFPHYGGRWSEWNGYFRDSVRRFVKGSEGAWAGAFASALCGSPNVFAEATVAPGDWWGANGGRQWRGTRGPSASVNFVTAHDGFSLMDLVSFNEKHNEANGEGNRDGENHNCSWNCGAEGETREAAVLRLRQRQLRNTALALLLAGGVPMLYMGDEYGHSKGGNNNTYCHDYDINYFRWDLAHRDANGFARFMRLLVNFRRSCALLHRRSYVTAREVQWHGDEPGRAEWGDGSRMVAFTLCDTSAAGAPALLYAAFNTSHLPRTVQLPRQQGRVWRQLVDTGKVAPYDFLAADVDEALRAAATTAPPASPSPPSSPLSSAPSKASPFATTSDSSSPSSPSSVPSSSSSPSSSPSAAGRPLCLSAAEVAAAHRAAAMWLADHTYPMMPWSCIVLESVPEESAV